MNDYYKFKKEDAYAFLNAINGVKGKDSNGNELTFQFCPYCFGGKNHDKNTFSISLTTGQFECKRASCGARGNMITLARDFADKFSLSDDVSIYYDINGRGGQFKGFKDAKRSIETRPRAVEYLRSRGIPEEVTKRYEITTMPDNDNVLVFPFKDENGNMTFVKYRNIEFDSQKHKSKEWCVAGNYKKILFGMNQCEDFETLVITEGQIDSLSCIAAGIKNAVSVPTGKKGFTWKPNVWNWLVKFNEIVVFGDNENGEITLAKEITQFFPKRVRVVQQKDYQGHKDANALLQNCGAEALVNAVNNAEVQVSLRIKDLSNVEKVDLDKIQAFPTGFAELDASIGRGFHEGEVIILTGKCGEGKSTFASQIVARMIQNGLKCFCYSGELPDYMFKAWLDYQIAGTKEVKEAERNAISEWYKGKCFIYDNSSVIDEKDELFSVMEQAVKDLGCKFVLIDNLMTAMEDKPNEDLFRQQGNFLTRLTKFAKGFNAIVLLIAHPRKGNSNDNDSISGSGDITNRANIVLRYQRKSKKKDEENQSLIMITKNRTTGKLNQDGILVFYDPFSMRISEGDNPCAEFMEENPVEFHDLDTEEIPF